MSAFHFDLTVTIDVIIEMMEIVIKILRIVQLLNK